MSFLSTVLALWNKRKVFTPDEIAGAEEWARAQAFTLSDVWAKKTLTAMRRVLAKAIEEGWTVQKFRAAATDVLARFKSGSYADLVYRVSSSQAEAAGNYSKMFNEERVGIVPFWRYVAVLDSRNDAEDECPDMICRGLHGKVFSKTDAKASHLLPPLHFNCRCFAVDMTEHEVQKQGRVITKASSLKYHPPEGWDYDRRALVPSIFGRSIGGKA